ncbi:PP2C family serine/threonine-protein phosphatase [Ectobacillus funiculus]|uniref:PP2C family serine/threonine-protein phosphatase n=1 Tax=Ectobacillus funiculus TaxID=137993 RepID=UPI00101CCAB0|nr:PP2C family serine/threonine-protein phosphatase [Ectobacillus funiculus]
MNKIDYAFASVPGPAHVANNLPNQDAVRIQPFSFGYVFVVADGMGSKKYSDIGSKAATKAVVEAVKDWYHKDSAPIHHIIRLVHVLWGLYIEPYASNDCATTCLFGVYLHNGTVILAQIGDGVIILHHQNELHVLKEKGDEYYNETMPLHSAQTLNDWAIKQFNVGQDDFMLFLGTDGVAEDIIEERRADYMQYLLDEITKYRKQKRRNLCIKKKLKTWANPNNTDDKSLIIFSRKVIKDVDSRGDNAGVFN